MNDRSRLNGVRVLVVDDAPYVLDIVRIMLERNGANVTAVGSPKQHLTCCNANDPTSC